MAFQKYYQQQFMINRTQVVCVSSTVMNWGFSYSDTFLDHSGISWIGNEGVTLFIDLPDKCCCGLLGSKFSEIPRPSKCIHVIFGINYLIVYFSYNLNSCSSMQTNLVSIAKALWIIYFDNFKKIDMLIIFWI